VAATVTAITPLNMVFKLNFYDGARKVARKFGPLLGLEHRGRSG